MTITPFKRNLNQTVSSLYLLLEFSRAILLNCPWLISRVTKQKKYLQKQIMLPEEKEPEASVHQPLFCKRKLNQIYPLALLEDEPPEALKGQVILISFV